MISSLSPDQILSTTATTDTKSIINQLALNMVKQKLATKKADRITKDDGELAKQKLKEYQQVCCKVWRGFEKLVFD